MEVDRPTPKLSDVELTRATLTQWFASQMPEADHVAVTELEIPESNGMSNVTILFELTWREQGEEHQRACVGRLEPENGGVVFPEYDLGLQYQVMEAIGKNSDIPVPPLFGLELDTSIMGVPFYVMQRIEGVVPSDMPPYNMEGWMVDDTSPAQRRNLWLSSIDYMATLHRLDYQAMGLANVEFKEPGETQLQKQLAYWRRYMDWGMEGREHLLAARALDWLEANQPVDEPVALCWGDARMGNVMFAPDYSGVNAMLDWEMVTLGNPVQDLAWWNHMDDTFASGLGVPRLEGLPSYEDTLAHWEKASGFSGEHYDYYEVFAGMRYTLILSRLMLHMGIEEMIIDHHAAPLLASMLDAQEAEI
ncbi:MAG: phosphotransferase family protein [Pseudomonadales bacterium]